MKVNIYVYHTIKTPKASEGAYTYILETEINEKTATLSKSARFKGPKNHADLEVILEALKRMNKPSEIEIIGTSNYISNGVSSIPKWEQNNWKTSKGTEVANKEEWQQFNEYMKVHTVTVNTSNEHSYSHWMKGEAEKKERE